MKNHHGGVILVGDHLYGHSDDVGWICMDFATGEQQVARNAKILGKGAIAYADGMFYCLSEDDGEVVLIEASPDGWKEHGRFKLDPQTEIRSDRGKIWTHPGDRQRQALSARSGPGVLLRRRRRSRCK